MFVRLMQATGITMALYALLALNTFQTSNASSTVESAAESAAETTEALVALKQALTRR